MHVRQSDGIGCSKGTPDPRATHASHQGVLERISSLQTGLLGELCAKTAVTFLRSKPVRTLDDFRMFLIASSFIVRLELFRDREMANSGVETLG